MSDNKGQSINKQVFEDVFIRIWDQVNGDLDRDRLFEPLEDRRRKLIEKLEKPHKENPIFRTVSGAAHAIVHGKEKARKNSEITLVIELKRLQHQVYELIPDRADDFKQLVRAGFDKPMPNGYFTNRE